MTPLTLLEAIGRMEGVHLTNSRPARNNNPGDIEWGKFSAAHGALRGDPRFAIFPNMDMGYACLKSLLSCPAYINLTVLETINRYAPPNENNVTNYVDLICLWVGCKPTDAIKDLL